MKNLLMMKIKNTTVPHVGDTIELPDESLRKVIRVDDNGLIWYRLPYGVGQTITSSIVRVIRINGNNMNTITDNPA